MKTPVRYFQSPRRTVSVLLRSTAFLGNHPFPRRLQSSLSTIHTEESKAPTQRRDGSQKQLPSLSIMPTRILLRTMMITSILSSPRLLDMCLPLMDRMSRTKIWLFNPDKNPLLHKIVRIMFYDHFVAGENAAEVRKTVASIKDTGFKGVILGYGKECLITKENAGDCSISDATSMASSAAGESAIDAWREGNLETIKMVEAGDFIAIKFTGAGPLATSALLSNLPPPPSLWASLLTICTAASTRGIRIWIDAEQQVFQPGIDAWALSLMRHHNANTATAPSQPPLIYTTFQAYLKSTPARIKQHLLLARAENWTLGIKLVRGAYIASEPNRALIHDTKAETDAAYDAIAEALLRRTWEGVEGGKEGFPRVALFLAGHNEGSVRRAYAVWRELVMKGEEMAGRGIEFGQLQGMADEVGCGLIQVGREVREGEGEVLTEEMRERLVPGAFKCLCWGGVQECMQFLVRRAVENKAAVERTREWKEGLMRELGRRMRFWRV